MPIQPKGGRICRFQSSEALNCELQHVLDYVNGAAVVADDGMDLTNQDLDDLLGIGVPGRVVTG
jgi:hypothetical protein